MPALGNMLFLGSVRVSGISSVALTAMPGCLQLANGQIA